MVLKIKVAGHSSFPDEAIKRTLERVDKRVALPPSLPNKFHTDEKEKHHVVNRNVHTGRTFQTRSNEHFVISTQF